MAYTKMMKLAVVSFVKISTNPYFVIRLLFPQKKLIRLLKQLTLVEINVNFLWCHFACVALESDKCCYVRVRVCMCM